MRSLTGTVTVIDGTAEWFGETDIADSRIEIWNTSGTNESSRTAWSATSFAKTARAPS